MEGGEEGRKIEMTVSAQPERCSVMGAFRLVEMKLLMLRKLALVEILELA